MIVGGGRVNSQIWLRSSSGSALVVRNLLAEILVVVSLLLEGLLVQGLLFGWAQGKTG